MKGFFFILIIPTIHEINTVHKEKVIKLKSLIYKQYLECWLLERGDFRHHFFQFSRLFSDFLLSGLPTTHAERLIQSLTGFLYG